MGFTIETPPGLKGTQEQQLLQVYSYLFRLSENLNVALNNLNKDNYSSATQIGTAQQTGTVEVGGDGEAADLSTSYNELRALINNTADIVTSEMDRISTELNGKYTAVSAEWGTFHENISSTITATAKGVVESYGYDAILSALDDQAAGFSSYKTSMDGYIRRGVFLDKDGEPFVGIAIGQDLKVKGVVDVNGVEYEEIDNKQSCAFYTSNKVSFLIGGNEVAYISNEELFIHGIRVTGPVILGGEWMITTDNGLKVQWIGEVQ